MVDLGPTTQQNTVGAGNDTLIAIENLTGSAFNDTLQGDGSNNLLSGGAGADYLQGNLGHDTLYGGDGNDTIYGDHTTGGLGDDVIYGEAGDDYINAGTGADYLDGGDVDDTLRGYGCYDDYIGGAGVDTVSYNYIVFGNYSLILDLATVKFLLNYSTKPLQIFGLLGLTALALGTLITGWLGYVRLFAHQAIAARPLLLLGMMLLFIGVQLVTFGLLAELLARTYYESQNKPTYVIREIRQTTELAAIEG